MATRKRNPITISNFNGGGLADSKWSGIEDSLYRMVGVDPHSEPAVLKSESKLTKNSGTTVDEFVKNIVVSSNGRTYHFSSASGKIWERTGAGAWSLVHTTTPAAGAAACLGAIEYEGYIIWATESRLHRILATDGEGSAEWTANAQEDWQTFTNTDDEFHPMIIQNLDLYIGDANYLALWDGSVFTADALDIKTPLRIKSLGKIVTDVLLGTYVDDNINKTEILRWNTWSVSFTTLDPIEEVGINAFIPADNFVFVSAGKKGNIYYYDGSQLELFKKIPAVYAITDGVMIHPDAVANVGGNQILFGVSNVSGNPAPQGVYRIGRHSRNYDWIMDLAYPISERSAGALVLTGIEIGAIDVIDDQIIVSWKNGATYGVDLLDASNKLDGAYIESRVMRPDRLVLGMFRNLIMSYNDLPTLTDLTLTFDKNYAGSYTTPTSSQVTDVDRKFITLEEGIEAVALQLKVEFTTNGNDTPSLESIDILLE